MAKRVYCDFYDLNNVACSVEVHDTSFSGTATTIAMGPVPVVIRRNGGQLKAICGSEATLTFVSAVDLSWLYTNDGVKLQVYVKRGGSTIWEGFILPDQYFKELRPLMTFTVQATDQLGMLSTIDYADGSGIAYEGYQDDILILSTALLKTGLALSIRSFVNLFEDTMNDADTDDPLAQAQSNQDAIVGDDLVPGSCYAMINHVLNGYQARICQSDGRWVIQRLKELTANELDYRDFDNAGAYVTNGTKTIAQAFNQTTFVMMAVSTMELYPGYRKLTVNSFYGKRTSLFRGYNFPEREFITATTLHHWTIEATSAWTRAQSGDNYLMKCANLTALSSTKYFESDKVAVSAAGLETYLLSINLAKTVSTGYLYIQLFIDEGGGSIWSYSQTANTWVNDDAQSIIPTITALGSDNLQAFQMVLEELPADGDLFIRIYDPVDPSSALGGNIHYVDDIIIIPTNDVTNYPESDSDETAIDADNNVDASYLLTCHDTLGKINEKVVYKNLKIIKASGLVATTWYLKGTPATLKSLQAWVETNNASNSIGSYGWRGMVRGASDFESLYDIVQISNQRFIPMDIEYNVRNATWYGDAIDSKGCLVPLDQTTAADNGRAGSSVTISGGSGGGGASPVAPDTYRAASVALTAGANTVTFSTPHPGGSSYTLRRQTISAAGYDVGYTITNRTAAGFTITVDEDCTLEYEAITIR